MHVTSAMLPDVASSQDRIFVTEHAVIVLDGATAFVSVEVSPSAYVDTLGEDLCTTLTADPEADLTEVLAAAIEHTARVLDLTPGAAPSSTVAIARQGVDTVDLLVLGDTQIATPHGIYVDNRIDQAAQAERAAYRSRLAAGHGYDDVHRELLRRLQAEQALHRNRDGGFWIAEADPAAAMHALVASPCLEGTPWLVLATDGVHRSAQHLGYAAWDAVAEMTGTDLERLLQDLHAWEAVEDSYGLLLPRAKRHDDKALAVTRFT